MRRREFITLMMALRDVAAVSAGAATGGTGAADRGTAGRPDDPDAQRDLQNFRKGLGTRMGGRQQHPDEYRYGVRSAKCKPMQLN